MFVLLADTIPYIIVRQIIIDFCQKDLEFYLKSLKMFPLIVGEIEMQ